MSAPSGYRSNPLPVAPLRGRFLLAAGLLEATGEALAAPGDHPEGDEALVYWAGRRVGPVTCLMTVVVPRAVRERYRVIVDEFAFGDAAARARSLGLGLVAQAHSHPGQIVEHSDGDDEIVTLPFAGMLSIVAPEYALRPLDWRTAGIHQFQDGRWVAVTAESAAAGIVQMPIRRVI